MCPFKYKVLIKILSRRWIPCWLLTNTAVTCAMTNFRCHKLIEKVIKQKNIHGKYYLQSVWGKTRYFKHWKYQNLGMNNKGIGDKNAICFYFLAYLLNICKKFKILISQGIVATCLRRGGWCRLGFVANFIRFPAVQEFWKSVKIWQSYREFKGGNFFRQCIIMVYNEIVASSSCLCNCVQWIHVRFLHVT